MLLCKHRQAQGADSFCCKKNTSPTKNRHPSRHPELDSGSVNHSAKTSTDPESSSGGRMWGGIPLQVILRVPQSGPCTRSVASSGLLKCRCFFANKLVCRNTVTEPVEGPTLICKQLPSTGSGGGLFVLQKTPSQRRSAIQAVIPNLIRDL